MKCLRVIGALLVLASQPVFAQDPFKKPQHSFFFYVAPGGVAVNHDGRSSLEIGGGGDVYIYRGLGFDGDVGAIRVQSRDSLGQLVPHWTGMVTLNAIYSFQRSAEQRVCPFVIGGFTAIPEFDVGGGINFGGGLHYWFSSNYGLRVEFREHVRNGIRTYHDVQGRIAIAFRK